MPSGEVRIRQQVTMRQPALNDAVGQVGRLPSASGTKLMAARAEVIAQRNRADRSESPSRELAHDATI